MEKITTPSNHFIKNIKFWPAFGITQGLYILISIILFNFIIKDETYYISLSNVASADTIKQLLKDNKYALLINYVSIPLLGFVKYALISLCIMAGSFFFEYKISFKRILVVVVMADVINIALQTIKLIWFGFFKTNFILDDLANFSPLSIASLFHITPQNGLFFLLNQINIFEIGFWLLLAYFLSKELLLSFSKSLGIVLKTYVAAFIVYVIAYTLITFK